MTTKIIECTKCQAPQVFNVERDIPTALEIDLNGGYAMFVDNWQDRDDYHLLLCHKCAHEFVNWLGLPQIGHYGHPKEDLVYCNGWTSDEWEEKAIKYMEEKINGRRV